MTENNSRKPHNDGFADVVSVLFLILIAVSTAVYWVSHQ
jgi:hypothetical protein